MDALTYNTEHIAAHFSRAVSTYDAAASLQMEYTRRAAEALRDTPAYARILDLGSGTGNFAKAAGMFMREWQVVGLDISKAMCQYAKENQHSVNANMQQLPFRRSSFDAAISAFALQWSNAPEGVMRELHQCLKPGATCIIQSFAHGTLEELRLCADHAGMQGAVNHFHSAEHYQRMMRESGFELIETEVKTHIKIYESPWLLFQELKALGATNSATLRRKGLSTRQKLKDTAKYYIEHFGDSYGIPAAWNVVHIQARKT